MRKRETMQAIARRLPHRTALDVEEILEVAVELWAAQLVAGETIEIHGLGRLKIDVHWMRPAGAIPKRFSRVRRVFGRYRPAASIMSQLEVNREQ